MNLDEAPARATITPPTENGHPGTVPLLAAPVVPVGPRMPRRLKWLDLPEEYGEAGMQVQCWVNYPSRLAQDIDSGDDERVFPALFQVVLAHNGWLDEQDQPVPPANTRLFWDTISTELAVTLLRLLSLEGSRLPSSLKRPNAS